MQTEQERIKEFASELETLYAIRASECAERFYEFVIEFWDIINEDELKLNWHIEYLCDQLQEVVERAMRLEPKECDVLINIPPGMSKSTILSQMLGAWAWIHAPHFVIFTSTNSNDLSIDQSLKSKQIVQSDRWQMYFQPIIQRRTGKRMFFTKNNEKDWRNNFGGVRFFTSVTGGIIGKHAHLIIWDDVIDVERSTSEAFRKKANRHVSKTLSTRKKDKEITPTIGIMQRLHEEDPTGYLLDLDPTIKHIKLPATASGDVKPPELRKFYKDGYLDPVRLNQKVLDEAKVRLGSYDYAGQYDQEPTPAEGGKIKKAWFTFCKGHEVPPGIVWDLWIDGAYTDKTENDPTGLALFGYDKRAKRLYVKHAKSERMEMPDLLREVPRYCEVNDLNNRSRVYIEPKASGHSLEQMLKVNSDLSAVLIRGPLVQEGKEARASVASPKIEAGQVVLIEGAWNDDFIAQIAGFPNLKHDEFIDLIGYACEEYFGGRKTRGVKRRN